MVEILFLGRFCDWVGEIANNKGYEARKYHMIALMLWCIGEALGLFTGLVIAEPAELVSLVAVYFSALVGAGIGAAIAVMVVRNLKVDQVREALTVFPTNGK